MARRKAIAQEIGLLLQPQALRLMDGKKESHRDGNYGVALSSVFAPQVCGSDDKTYTSSCAAGCANVKPQYTGACKPIATSE